MIDEGTLQQTVNGATAETNKLQRQINQNDAKMGEATDATDKLTAEIDKQEKEPQELQWAYSRFSVPRGCARCTPPTAAPGQAPCGVAESVLGKMRRGYCVCTFIKSRKILTGSDGRKRIEPHQRHRRRRVPLNGTGVYRDNFSLCVHLQASQSRNFPF